MNTAPSTLGLTREDTYFEDYVPEDVIRHHRGKTVSSLEAVLLCNLVMNTADGHFNDHAMSASLFGRAIMFGGITASLVVGLASQDTAENALEELGIEEMELPNPVVQGDTVYAYTRILSAEPDGPEAGVVRFEHWGANQRDEVVCRLVRRARIARRPRTER